MAKTALSKISYNSGLCKIGLLKISAKFINKNASGRH